MAFQIKDFRSIVASMVNWMRASQSKVTDFNVGSVARTLVEAPAVEIEELYQQYFIGLREAIPVATFKSFGFDLLGPAIAIGAVSAAQDVARTTNLVIPAGTTFESDDGRTWSSTAATTWATGETFVRIPVAAASAGAAWNAPEGTVNKSAFFGTGVTISNQAITSGRDAETEAERETRFAEFVASLSRGTNDAIRYAAGQAKLVADSGWITEYVTRVGLAEVPGRTTVYLYASIGVPSSELITAAQRTIDGYRIEDTGEIVTGVRAAGVQVDVVAMAERTVSMAADVELLAGYTMTAAINQSLQDAFGTAISGLQSGSVLYLDELGERLRAVRGIRRVVLDSDENIVCDIDEALKPGALTIEVI